MSYRLVKYDPKYLPGLLHLQRHLWTGDASDRANYFAWKYEQNPYLDDILIYLALEGELVVGMRGVSGARWGLAGTGRSFLAPCGCDTVVAPDHRRKGLMRDIFRFMAADQDLSRFPYLLNLSAGAAVYSCQLSEGWHALGPYDTATWSHGLLKQPLLDRSRSLARRVLGKPLRGLLRRAAGRVVERRGGALPKPVVRSETPRPHDMAGLVAETEVPGRISHVRDEGYYAWRFRSPLSNYRFYYWQDTSLKGFLVTQQSKGVAGAPINIVEWQGESGTVLEDLLRAAIKDAGLGTLALWTATLPAAVSDLLDRQSFERPQSRASNDAFVPGLMMTCLNESLLDDDGVPGLETFGDMERWALRMIYSDMH